MQNNKQNRFVFTSQNVTSGHPDKLCDRISDAILDHCIKQDPEARVACQCAVKNSLCFVFGEISGKFENNFEQVIRNTIKKVGYDNIQKGMDYKNVSIIIAIDKQSEQIAQSVIYNKDLKDISAGDQGLMIGYATDQTENYMPLTHQLCNKLVAKIQQVRNNGQISWLGPDGKVQVSIQYKKQNGIIIPIRVHTVLISVQHQASITQEQIQSTVKQKIIKSIINQKFIDQKTIFLINPSKSFVVGGPSADGGLTGRKIICDTYGGWGGHGGGAFSGKDPTKVDRSGAYAARWIAKSLVANKFCKKCLVQISYSIGISQPLSLYIDSYNTVVEGNVFLIGYTDYDLQQIVRRNFDLRPGMIIHELDLRKPIYQKTSSGGHFGRNQPQFKWECVKNLQHQKKK